MSVFDIDTLRRMIEGQWLHQPQQAGLARITGVGIDSREDLTGRAFFAIKGETHDGHDYVTAAAENGVAIVVVERDVAIDPLPPAVGVIRVDSTRAALAKLALAHRCSLSTTTIIAITGSSGKTTTKRIMHSVLSQALAGTCAPRSFNNDIGVPLTLLAANASDQFVIVEVGTNAPGEIAMLAAIAQPDIAVITNIGRAHLEGLGTVEYVAREKSSLLSHVRDGGTAVINADCPLLREYRSLVPDRVLFGESEEADIRLTDRGATHGSCGSWFEVNGRQRFEIALPGRHNALNAMAAIAVSRQMDVSDEHIAAGLLAVEPEPMRMAIERIGEIDLINDAYNANPDSVIASLRTFSEIAATARRRVIILGDMLELGDAAPQMHREIGRELRKLHQSCSIDRLILVGELARHIVHEVNDLLTDEHLIQLATLDDCAVESIASHFASGDAILLKASRRIGLERIAEHMKQCAHNHTVRDHLPASRSDAALP